MITKQKTAFTLVEMSIVITIVALLIAGISGGSRLLFSSKINKVISELEKIKTSINTFEGIYEALPGDFAKASNFFSSSSCTNHATFSQLTCNGDGNGIIGSMYAADGKVGEHVYVYLHLSLAKTYKGDFESSPNSSETKYISINQNNTPFFELEKKGYYAFWGKDNGVTPIKILMGTRYEGSNSSNVGKPYSPAFTGVTGYRIDRKIDNGNFSNGNVIISTGLSDTTVTCSKSSTSVGCYAHIYF